MTYMQTEKTRIQIETATHKQTDRQTDRQRQRQTDSIQTRKKEKERRTATGLETT